MITNRVSRALMITVTMTISTTFAEAQRVDSDALLRLSQGSEASATEPALTAVAMESAARQEARHRGDDTQAHKNTIVGSWLDTVSVTGGPTFNSLSTNTSDGDWVFHDQGSVITGQPFPHVFSAGHGVWVQLGGRTYSQTAVQLISDLEGNLLFRNKLRQTLTLHKSGDAYRSVWKAEFTDAAGNLAASFEGTTEGQRIRVERLP